jgi:uncharacterized protein VirK/YbjX
MKNDSAWLTPDVSVQGRVAPVTVGAGMLPGLQPIAYWREYLKLQVRALARYQRTARWLLLLNSQPLFAELLGHCPRLMHKIYRPYLSKAVSPDARVDLIAAHYAFIRERGLEALVLAAARDQCLIAEIEGKSGLPYALRLRAVNPMEREGELVLQLCGEGNVIYSLAFTLSGNGVDQARVLNVGCLQGCNGGVIGASIDAPEAIRTATRELHGLRPKYLLVHLIRSLGWALGCSHLRLVGNDNRVVRSAMRQGKVCADYNLLWQEFGASQGLDGDFQLACAPWEEPDLELVASKKRAEARRKIAIMCSLNAALAQRFGATVPIGSK